MKFLGQIGVVLLLVVGFSSTSTAVTGSTIEGTVLRASDGSPLKNARVKLEAPEAHDRSARTNARGVFRFTGVPKGSYRLSVSRAGFCTEVYRRTILVDGDKPARGIEIRMQAQAVIVGKVVDDEGEPRAGVQVRAVLKGSSTGLPRSAATNDLGEYRLYGLPPGDYYLVASDSGNEYLTDNDVSNGYNSDGGDREFAPTYYPGVTNRSDATTLHISPGQELRMDLKLIRARMPSVSGVIRVPLGTKSQDASVALWPSNADGAFLPWIINGRPDARGHFVLPRVPPGDYIINASYYIATRQLVAREHLRVDSRDVIDVSLTPIPGSVVRGRVTMKNGAPIPTDLMLWLRNRDGEDSGFAAAEVETDGTFTFMPSLPPGTYDLSVNGGNGNTFIGSASFGSQNVVTDGLAITSGAPNLLQLTLDCSGAQIAGILEDDRQPLSGATLQLVKDEHSRPVASSTADDLGVFSFAGVPPGNYTIIGSVEAADEPRPLGSIEVAEGEQKVVRLDWTSSTR